MKTLPLFLSVVCCIRKRIQLSSNQMNLMREFAKHTLVVVDERTRKHKTYTHTYIRKQLEPRDGVTIGDYFNSAGNTKRHNSH